MKLLQHLLSAALVTALTASIVHAAPINAVNNGSFETGDFTGWTLIGDQTFNSVTCAPGFGADGACSAFFGPLGTTGGISQTIGGLQPGTDYIIRFALNATGDVPSSAMASFGSVTLLNLTNPTTATPFSTYTFDVKATTSSANLLFTFRDDTGFIKLDAISVAVPEPATWALISAIFAALGLARGVTRRTGAAKTAA